MAVGLWKNRTLKNLSLKDNYIGDKGATTLGHILKYNTGLTEIDVSQNVYDDDGKIAIYNALAYNTTIQTLYLGYHDGLEDWYRDMLRERFGPEEFPEEKEYNEAITDSIMFMWDHNDTLKNVKDESLPWNIQNVHLEHCSQQFVEPYQWIDRVAPKKGQRQKHDMYNWLHSNQQDWPILIP